MEIQENGHPGHTKRPDVRQSRPDIFRNAYRALLFTSLSFTGCVQFDRDMADTDIAKAASPVEPVTEIAHTLQPEPEKSSPHVSLSPTPAVVAQPKRKLQVLTESTDVITLLLALNRTCTTDLMNMSNELKKNYINRSTLMNMAELFKAITHAMDVIRTEIDKETNKSDSNWQIVINSYALLEKLSNFVRNGILSRLEILDITDKVRSVISSVATIQDDARFKNALYGLLNDKLQAKYPFWQFCLAWDTMLDANLKKLFRNVESFEISTVEYNETRENIRVNFAGPSGSEVSDGYLIFQMVAEYPGFKFRSVSIKLTNGTEKYISDSE